VETGWPTDADKIDSENPWTADDEVAEACSQTEVFGH